MQIHFLYPPGQHCKNHDGLTSLWLISDGPVRGCYRRKYNEVRVRANASPLHANQHLLQPAQKRLDCRQPPLTSVHQTRFIWTQLYWAHPCFRSQQSLSWLKKKIITVFRTLPSPPPTALGHINKICGTTTFFGGAIPYHHPICVLVVWHTNFLTTILSAFLVSPSSATWPFKLSCFHLRVIILYDNLLKCTYFLWVLLR